MPESSGFRQASAASNLLRTDKFVMKPNLFLVGAPKSGTTALYSYLRQHPEIFMCRPKEPQFFADDTCGHQRTVSGVSEYLSCFADAKARVIGEASTCYLSAPEAPAKIKEFSPDARIVIMLRSPVDVMHAEHNERLTGGMEHIADFEQAVDSKEPRFYRFGQFQGERVVRPSYREIVEYPPQVKRYQETFGQSRVHILVYDDFANDNRQAYRAVLAFLGVSLNHECSAEVVNANRKIRSRVVHDLVAAPPDSLRRVARVAVPQWLRRKVGAGVVRMNEQYAPRPEIPPAFRRRLLSSCAGEVEALGQLLNRDLSAWLAD